MARPKQRVMVVDDDPAFRVILRKVIDREPDLLCVGSAKDGVQALARIGELRPDVLVLDMEMPNLDGLETLRQLRADGYTVPVVLYTAHERDKPTKALDALLFDPCTLVPKPVGAGANVIDEHYRGVLLPTIRSMAADARRSVAEPETSAPAAQALPRSPSTEPPEIVAVGVSTGGPAALMDLVSSLPAAFSAPLVIVLHTTEAFAQAIAQRLDEASPLQVELAYEGAELQPGTIWMAPGDAHVEIGGHAVKRTLHLSDAPPENHCRPAVDVLFRSVAEVYGNRGLGVVLTGMGSDGLKGAEQMVSRGAEVWAQDETTSVVWGMPRAVVEAGIASKVLPIDAVAVELRRRLGIKS